MPFTPEELPPGSRPFFEDAAGHVWTPLYMHGCSFTPDIFHDRMLNFIRNPNLNSSWLFRADILHDDDPQGSELGQEAATISPVEPPLPPYIQGFQQRRSLVRRLIPGNERRDAPMDQTCAFYTSAESEGRSKSLVLYIPHSAGPEDIPFYHPKVRGIAHLHEWNSISKEGRISVHFLAYPEISVHDQKLVRIAYHLLEILDKHGRGQVEGYVKRVHHDVIVPRAKFQDRFANLKGKYARRLIEEWAESTDPSKHVFEDLSIAAFLMELWADMYKDGTFPGFVDIGCGNGLLVYILNQEGFLGWGFDARERKSWKKYSSPVSCSPSGTSLEMRLLLPSIVPKDTSIEESEGLGTSNVHNGTFPPGTFVISNHADELTPWTPILATVSECPFIMIPCCSHNLTADKFRAPAPRDKTKPKSQYASLVDWVTCIAEDCGWEVETEMLRIPSTRNIGLLGRKRTRVTKDVDLLKLLEK
ncbi:hypothetical protein S40293_06336 [Stachybotrys chartarum IBT 40293]|nr:hypothetical protein S40293_06336 [Stachybotrys chartarum IBT 40293]